MYLPRTAYNALLYAAAPLACLYLSKRAKKQPEYKEHWDERFGTAKYPSPIPQRTRIWIHAVSVGEMRAAIPLIEGILHRWPNVDIMLTCMTPTGRKVAESIMGRFLHRISVSYLPYDTTGFMNKFMKETKPALCILMETEVWPNLTYIAKKRGIPVILANARLSEKSLKKGEKIRSLLGPAMGRLTVTLAQSDDDAFRLKKAGCKVIQVCGNMKFDFEPNQSQLRSAEEFRKRGSRRIVVLASSRDGEEEMFLEAFEKEKARWKEKDVLFFIVPRHPQRFEDVYRMIENKGFSAVKRSQIRNWREILSEGGPDFVLGDSMGEMALYYGLADVVLMGGSFKPFGSQSMIEPLAIGRPTIVGPSIFNFEDTVLMAEKADAVRRTENFEGALRLAWNILEESGEENQLRENALKFSAAQKGATEKTLTIIDKILGDKESVKEGL